MDWDDERPKPKKQIVVGDALTTLSVDELTERIEALKDEITRTEGELKAKKSQSAAADKLFKS